MKHPLSNAWWLLVPAVLVWIVSPLHVVVLPMANDSEDTTRVTLRAGGEETSALLVPGARTMRVLLLTHGHDSELVAETPGEDRGVCSAYVGKPSALILVGVRTDPENPLSCGRP